MKSLKLNKEFVPYVVALALILYIISVHDCKEEVKIEVPEISNSKIIEAPVERIRIDTVYIDTGSVKNVIKLVPVENPINKELLAKYEAAMNDNDSLKQKALYLEAITERLYIETLEDSVQLITVESEVVGTLKQQTIKYKIKPKTYTIETERRKPSLYAGGFVSSPIETASAASVGAELLLLNKKQTKLFKVGYDTQKRLHFGVTFKLFKND